ncbi:MAG: ribonucleoside-diphosphate reductase subunit alpha [Desulfovibrionaceae bacterium]
MKTVTLRDGTKEAFDLNKIREKIEIATEGLDINPMELEACIESVYVEEIRAADIQKGLIYSAISKASHDKSDWVYVAGRLLMLDIQHQVAVERVGAYSSDIKRESKSDISWIENKGYHPYIYAFPKEKMEEVLNSIHPERDLVYDYAGANMLVERYLHHDANGRLVELPQEMFMLTAVVLASSGEISEVLEIYNALSLRKISLATPMLANLRFENRNIASCFITRAHDSIDAIFDTVKSIAKVSQEGGGIGVHLSRIRAKGASVRKTPNVSGGVVPWVKIMNDTAVAVNQQGRRAGAVTVALDTWHNDIDHFLELQTENGDQRGKAYDVYPQVCVSDEFMRRVEAGLSWTTYCPNEVLEKVGIDLTALFGDVFTKAYESLENNKELTLCHYYPSARDLLKQILKVQIETGMPYIFFRDTANNNNLNKETGVVDCGNLCMESFSSMKDNMDHTCNLISLNISEMNVQEIHQYSSLAVVLLNRALNIGMAPIAKAQNHNNFYRTIGIGVAGLADYLANNEILYAESDEEVNTIFKEITYSAIRASIFYAKEYGAYEGFRLKPWEEYITSRFADSEYIDELLDLIRKHGIANGELTAVAPNTSTSLILGCSASVLPIFDTFFVEKNQRGAVPRVAKYIKTKKWYYTPMKRVPQKDYIRILSKVSKWVTQGVSMELMFDLNGDISARDIYETILYAWKQQCKTIYYIRSVQKNIQDISCSSCAN